MLQVFSINVYELLNLGATLSFLTLLVSIKFFMLPDILDEPFLVSTLVGDLVVSESVFKGSPIYLPNTVILVDLVEL